MYSGGGLGDRVSPRRCGDWSLSNLTTVSAYVALSLDPNGKDARAASGVTDD